MSVELAISVTKLRQLIDRHFNLEEVELLCFDLNVDDEAIAGQTKPTKIKNLIVHLEQRKRLPELLSLLNAQRPGVDWEIVAPAEPEAESPFKGLQYFTEKDALLFFGRESLTKELVEHLCQHRFLALIGASGSGKSSVVRAGLMPAVRRGEVEFNGRRSDSWSLHIMTPGDEPLKALAGTLTRDSESVTAMASLLEDMLANSQSLDLWLYREFSNQPASRLLLVVDQFEELFTQCNDAKVQKAFVENLTNAIQSEVKGHLTLVLALRADFYASAVKYKELHHLLETRQRIVGAMTPEELRLAIEKPAEKERWQFQPGLVETILQDIGNEPGSLPLLSHALLETWKQREGRTMTLLGYQASGGVRKAISRTADSVYQTLSPEQQAIVRNIFLRLTELGEGTEDTRRIVRVNELIPQVERSEIVHEVLNVLTNARLVTTYENTVEVAHEALIREWPVLRQWLDENREGLRLHRQLTQDVRIWEELGQDSDALYRGARLALIDEWLREYEVELNDLESSFIKGSLQWQEQEIAEQETQRRRELETAQKLAEAERKRAEEETYAANQLRRRNYFMSFALIIALITTAFSIFFALRSTRDRDVALESLSILQVIGSENPEYQSIAFEARATAEAISPPTPIPEIGQMTGDLRIAIAGFQMTGDEIPEFLDGLGQSIYLQLVDELEQDTSLDISVQVWGPDRIGTIEGLTTAERTRLVSQIAAEINAGVIIYGAADINNGMLIITPEFYISDDYLSEATDGIEITNLVTPISIPIDNYNNIASRIIIAQDVSSLALIVSHISIGSAFYLIGDYEQALNSFHEAENIEREPSKGYEVLYYLIGNTLSKMEEFELARSNYEKSLEINPEYSPAYVGLADTYYGSLLVSFEETLGPETMDPVQIQLAIDTYKQALSLAGPSAQSYVTAKANFGLGQAYFLLTYSGEVDNFDSAISQFHIVIDEYEAGSAPHTQELVGEAHARLGLIYQFANDYERAIQEYTAAIDILEDIPDRNYRIQTYSQILDQLSQND